MIYSMIDNMISICTCNNFGYDRAQSFWCYECKHFDFRKYEFVSHSIKAGRVFDHEFNKVGSGRKPLYRSHVSAFLLCTSSKTFVSKTWLKTKGDINAESFINQKGWFLMCFKIASAFGGLQIWLKSGDSSGECKGLRLREPRTFS